MFVVTSVVATALHVLCLNPDATPDMFKLITNAYPDVARIEVAMFTRPEDIDAVKCSCLHITSQIMTEDERNIIL